MKRVLCLVIALMCLIPAALAEVSGDFEYEIVGSNTAWITGYTNRKTTKLTLPTELDGYPVVAVSYFGYNDLNKITQLTVPEGYTRFSTVAFDNLLPKLTTLNLPASLERWDVDSQLEPINAPKLAKITVSPQNQTFRVDENVLFDQQGARLFLYPAGLKASTYTVPQGVTDLKVGAFNGAKLKTLSLPDSLTIQGTQFYLGEMPSLTAIKVSPSHPSLMSVDGVLFSKDGKVLYHYPAARKGKEYVIPAGVERIHPHAFEGAKNLTKVFMPDSVTQLGRGVFENCPKLAEVTLSRGLTQLSDYAFHFCKKLKKITLPEGMTEVGEGAFFDCRGLKEIIFPATMRTLGMNAFCNCDSLKTVTLPQGLTTVETGCFYACQKLKTLTVPASVEKIEADAFPTKTKMLVTPYSAGYDYAVANGHSYDLY